MCVCVCVCVCVCKYLLFDAAHTLFCALDLSLAGWSKCLLRKLRTMLPDLFFDPPDIPTSFLSFTLHWLPLKQKLEYKISSLGLLVFMGLNVHRNLARFFVFFVLFLFFYGRGKYKGQGI